MSWHQGTGGPVGSSTVFGMLEADIKNLKIATDRDIRYLWRLKCQTLHIHEMLARGLNLCYPSMARIGRAEAAHRIVGERHATWCPGTRGDRREVARNRGSPCRDHGSPIRIDHASRASEHRGLRIQRVQSESLPPARNRVSQYRALLRDRDEYPQTAARPRRPPG